jgi:hypothetical protein
MLRRSVLFYVDYFEKNKSRLEDHLALSVVSLFLYPCVTVPNSF